VKPCIVSCTSISFPSRRVIEASSGCVGDITEPLMVKARVCSDRARRSSAAQKGVVAIGETGDSEIAVGSSMVSGK